MKSTSLSIIIAGLIIAGALFFTRSGNQPKTKDIQNVSIVNGIQIIDLTAKGGYQPSHSFAKAGIPTILRVNTKGTLDCSSAIRIPKLKLAKNLPMTGSADFDLGVQNVGILEGACGMGMYPFDIEFKS